MFQSKNNVLPNWLTMALTVAFVLSGVAVLIFAFLTVQVIVNRPVNPPGRNDRAIGFRRFKL